MSKVTDTLVQQLQSKLPGPIQQVEDRRIAENIDYYTLENEQRIKNRIEELNDEWDVERTVQLNASAVVLIGLLLGVTLKSRWLLLPFGVSSLLLAHAIKNYKIKRAMPGKMRTRREISKEQYGLEMLLKNDLVKKHDSNL